MKERVLLFDCFSGISGDMVISSLVELGVPQQYLISELKKLPLSGYRIDFSRAERRGIWGLRADVVCEGEESGHRHLRDIQDIFHNSGLPRRVQERALEIFDLIAEAESTIHNSSREEVHFHEVGAVDSIVDIAAAAICIDYLSPERILFTPLQLGGGSVHCQHGTFPVPAPACLEILRGIPVRCGAAECELTTPTGAAIARTFADEFIQTIEMTPEKCAYGIGHRDTPAPNVLRVMWAQREKPEKQDRGALPAPESALILECNIDDMNPELYPPLIESLLDAGADDAFLEPITMKKGRPAVRLSVLCSEAEEECLGAILLKESSSFGYRRHRVEKRALERKLQQRESSLGTVQLKTAYLGGKAITQKLEFEDCRRIAKEQRLTLPEVYRILQGELYDR